MKLIVSPRLLRSTLNNIKFIRTLSNYTQGERIHVNRTYLTNLNRPRIIQHTCYSSNPTTSINDAIDPVTYNQVCTDTLESLFEYLEELLEKIPHLNSPDITFGDGVLTVKFGEPYGTYVINRQTPNKQIWLSSPTSGPKRYDFVKTNDVANQGYWIYKHDGVTLHELLQNEITQIVKQEVKFLSLIHGKK